MNIQTEKKRVVILFGGYSSEYEISLQSAAAVLRHLNSGRFLDHYEIIPVGITRDGRWLRYYDSLSALLLQIESDTWHLDKSCVPSVISPCRGDDSSSSTAGLLTFFPDGSVDNTPIDMAFPLLHGRNGEDGRLQGLIEMAGIRLIGCGTLSSALCMDKYRAHQLAAAAGISVPAAITLKKQDLVSASDRAFSPSGYPPTVSPAQLRDLTCDLTYPLFVKPVKEGSSHGITRITSHEQLLPAVLEAFAYDDEVIIEESVSGFEVGCAVLDDGQGGMITGRVDEIELMTEGFFDYRKKYEEIDSKIHTPARIDPLTEALIAETARNIYRTLDCHGFARVDMFLTPAHEIVFNEVNTVPGMTAHSRFPKMLETAGISFGQVLEGLLSYH